MNKLIKRVILAVLICSLVAASGTITTLAADTKAPDLVFSITKASTDADAIKVTEGTKNFHFKSIVPGDTMTQTIKVKNNTSQTTWLTLKANINSGINNQAPWVKLARLIEMTTSDTAGNVYQTNLLGEGRTTGTGGITSAKELTKLNPGEEYSMNVKMYVPADKVDNEFASMVINPSEGFSWVLSFSFDNGGNPTPTRPTNPPGGNTIRPGSPGGTDRQDTDRDRTSGGTSIPDSDTPLSSGYTSIDESATPLQELPKTGSERFAISGILFGVFALAGVLAFGSKKELA